MNNKPIILLDIDGVLNHAAKLNCTKAHYQAAYRKLTVAEF